MAPVLDTLSATRGQLWGCRGNLARETFQHRSWNVADPDKAKDYDGCYEIPQEGLLAETSFITVKDAVHGVGEKARHDLD
jgi:hypothetical protein